MSGILRAPFAFVAAAVTLIVAASAAEASDWTEIGGLGEVNGMSPGCSGAPGTADAEFSFFVREGASDNVAIFFDGGGACSDPNTCIGTAIGDLPPGPIYTPAVDETAESLAELEGLGDLSNQDNPIRDFNLVYIPYCTADLHIGANIASYDYTPVGGSSQTYLINHVGAVNVAAVLRWLVQDSGWNLADANKAFLAGASAGGYGVLYHYPGIRALFPRSTAMRLLVDASNGIISEGFYNDTLTEDGVWRARDYLPAELVPAFDSGPDDLIVETIKAVAAIDPYARIGQYTTAFDAVQIGFYNIGRNVDDPARWFDPLELLFASLDWATKVRLNMFSTALQAWNFRYYLASGADHTIVPTDEFYSEDSARDVLFSDWLDDMINRRFLWGSDWRNLSCAPTCAE
jgi:hypothetical protein